MEGKTKATISFYRGNLGRILWWWCIQGYPKDIADITADHIRALLNYVQTEPKRFGDCQSAKWDTF